MDLKDRVALIAGGTGLLGTAIARALAGAGADIAITYLERKDAARETARPSRPSGAGPERHPRSDQCRGHSPAVEAVVKHFGHLDMLVNNAAWNISIHSRPRSARYRDLGPSFATTSRPYFLARAARRI